MKIEPIPLIGHTPAPTAPGPSAEVRAKVREVIEEKPKPLDLAVKLIEEVAKKTK